MNIFSLPATLISLDRAVIVARHPKYYHPDTLLQARAWLEAALLPHDVQAIDVELAKRSL